MSFPWWYWLAGAGVLLLVLYLWSKWEKAQSRALSKEIDRLREEDYQARKPWADFKPTKLNTMGKVIKELGGRDNVLKQDFAIVAQNLLKKEIAAREEEAKAQGKLPIPYCQEYYGVDRYEDLWKDILVGAFASWSKTLPDYVSFSRKPLFWIDPWPLGTEGINTYFHYFKKEEVWPTEHWPFYGEYLQYQKNWYSCRTAVEGKFYDKNSPTYYKALVDGTESAKMFLADLPLSIPPKLFAEGCWILAPRGRGKTTLLSNLLLTHLDEVARGEASIIVMDMKTELTQHLKKAAMFGKGGKLEDRLSIIEPWPNLALNPFDMGGTDEETVSLIRYLLNSLLDTEMTAKQKGLLNHVIIAVRHVPGATFKDLMRFLKDWKPYEDTVRKLDAHEREFYVNGTYDEPLTKKTRDEIYWRLDGFLTEVPRMRTMFSAPETKFNMGKEMDAGNVVVINNSQEILKGGTTFFSRFFLLLCLNAAEARARKGTKLPVYIYIDECDMVIGDDPLAAEIMNRCRSQNVGMILAHQAISQIGNEKVLNALQDCSIKFGNAGTDASRLAHLFGTSADNLSSLNRGEFMLWMYDQKPTPLRVRVDIPGNHVSTWPAMPVPEFGALLDRMVARYTYTPAPQAEEPPPSPSPTDTAPQPWKG